MSANVPAMTSMVAGQSMYTTAPATTYGLAPTMTSMYMPAATATAAFAAPPTTAIAPASTAIAAPLTAVASFVPPPMGLAVPQVPTAMSQVAVAEPAKLTAGLPQPPQIEAEKKAYEKALQEQLEKQSKAVMEEAKIKQAMLTQQATAQKQQLTLQIDEKLAIDCLRVEQEALNMVNGLKEAAITQQTMQEERAAIAVADFNKKRAIEEMSLQAWNIQQKWYQNEVKLMGEYQQVMQKGSKAVVTPQSPMLPPPQSPMLTTVAAPAVL